MVDIGVLKTPGQNARAGPTPAGATNSRHSKNCIECLLFFNKYKKNLFVMINIDKEWFVEVCNNAKTMAEASRILGIHFNTFIKYAKKYGCYRPNQSGKGTHKKNNGNHIELQEILEGKHPEYQTYKLKNKLIKEGIKENKCECCGITEWNGKPIPFELHHIDGNKFNHRLENLILLCPNCHSQTETFRAKNISKKNTI